jgi:hypothetical protein
MKLLAIAVPAFREFGPEIFGAIRSPGRLTSNEPTSFAGLFKDIRHFALATGNSEAPIVSVLQAVSLMNGTSVGATPWQCHIA